jgi:hypothetical protein
MTQSILRVLIQEKLAHGRFPRTHIPRTWGGPRNGKGLLRGLTLAAFAALGTMTCVASAGAATAITECMTLSTFGGAYVLANDLASCGGTCLEVANDRITIDLAGHTIAGPLDERNQGLCSDAGVGAGITTDSGTARQVTTIKNGTITGFFGDGINLDLSTRNLILNLTSSFNSGGGIFVGARSLVKGCVIADNGGNGITIGDFGQIQDCEITGNAGGFGIFGGHHMLVKDNIVSGNQLGINVGDFGTVTYNESSKNTFRGLFSGNRSLVTGNTTNENGIGYDEAGIATGGLSSVTYNFSNQNGGGGIDVALGGPFEGTRSLVTGNITNRNGGIGVAASCPSTVTNNRSLDNGLMNYDIGKGCHSTNNK